MVANAVLSVVGFAALGTEVPGNMVMHRNNVFQYRSSSDRNNCSSIRAMSLSRMSKLSLILLSAQRERLNSLLNGDIFLV